MLNSVDDVVNALGGSSKTAAIAGILPSAVSNWRARGEIPADNFLLISEALKAIGAKADPKVFGFKSEVVFCKVNQ